jgi:hypothetical protein
MTCKGSGETRRLAGKSGLRMAGEMGSKRHPKISRKWYGDKARGKV